MANVGKSMENIIPKIVSQPIKKLKLSARNNFPVNSGAFLRLCLMSFLRVTLIEFSVVKFYNTRNFPLISGDRGMFAKGNRKCKWGKI